MEEYGLYIVIALVVVLCALIGFYGEQRRELKKRKARLDKLKQEVEVNNVNSNSGLEAKSDKLPANKVKLENTLVETVDKFNIVKTSDNKQTGDNKQEDAQEDNVATEKEAIENKESSVNRKMISKEDENEEKWIL